MSKCSKCGNALPDGVKFCPECGHPVPQERHCSSCGAKVVAGAKFCPECGASITGVSSIGGHDLVAGDVAVSAPGVVGGHAVVGGDVVSHVTNITHRDASKEIVACAVCGRQVVVTEAFVCSDCGKSFCGDHFDAEHRMCRPCREQQLNAAEVAFREMVRDALKANERLDDAVIARLAEKRRSLGLDEARGRQILAEERKSGGDARHSAEYEEARRRVLEKASDLLYREGRCDQVVALLEPMIQVGQLDEEAREILLTALFTADPARGDEIASGTLADSRSVSLYQIDRHIAHDDLGPVGSLLDAAEKKWPSDVLVTCRRAMLDRALFKRLDDRTYLDKAAAVLSKIEKPGRLDEAAWLLYTKNLLALTRGEDPTEVADDEPFRALLQGRLSEKESGPTRYYLTDRLYQLAEKYYFGNDVDQSYEMARKYGLEAAERGHAGAQKMLGVMYECGFGVAPSPATAVDWYTKAVAAKEHDAEYFLGYLYERGKGVRQSYAEAEKLYRRAAEAGHRKSQYRLGNLYYNGHSVPQSYDEAVRWYRKSAERDCAEAMFKLGLAHECGRGVPQSYEEAARWYRKAADAGDTDGQSYLATLYEAGKGVQRSLKTAYELYLAAAERGNLAAMNRIGRMYDDGRYVEQSYVEAVKWFRRAAEGGYVHAQYNLGYFYDKGLGVPQSYEEAAKWYRKAAEQGEARAECDYGRMLAFGLGVCQSDSGAVDWYHRSAEQGNAAAQGNLAYMYETGRGIRQSYAEAVVWYRRAIEQGEARSQAALGDMYVDGRGVGRSYSEALRLYRLSADQNYAYAKYRLGFMYENGYGVDRSLAEAKKWYEGAAVQGDQDAKEALARLSSPQLDDGNSASERKTSPMTVLFWAEIAVMALIGVGVLCCGHTIVASAMLYAMVATAISKARNDWHEWRWILPCPLAIAAAIFGVMENWLVSAILFVSICYVVKEGD